MNNITYFRQRIDCFITFNKLDMEKYTSFKNVYHFLLELEKLTGRDEEFNRLVKKANKAVETVFIFERNREVLGEFRDKTNLGKL